MESNDIENYIPIADEIKVNTIYIMPTVLYHNSPRPINLIEVESEASEDYREENNNPNPNNCSCSCRTIIGIIICSIILSFIIIFITVYSIYRNNF